MSFQVVHATEAQEILMQIFRDKFEDITGVMEQTLPDFSREKSICITKLEEAAFWLNKAITEND